MRDPWGFRPLSVGRLPLGGHAVASETCALSTLGCVDIDEVRPGEIVTLQGAEVRRHQALAPATVVGQVHVRVRLLLPARFGVGRPQRPPRPPAARCRARHRVGGRRRRRDPGARLLDPRRDRVRPAQSGLPFNDGLIKNRYIGRTFIEPTQDIRDRGVALKFNALAENLAGKRVVMIDDSLVRGTTAGPLVKLVRDAGATEVHMRITCPPITHACHFGVDMGHDGDLMAARLTVPEMCAQIGADSLAFLSLEGMMRAIDSESGLLQRLLHGPVSDRRRGGPGQALVRGSAGVVIRVLVVGGGGREQAIAWACRRHGHAVELAARPR